MTNSRFEDLERRCQKIKRARIAKIVLFFTFISFLVSGYFYINSANFILDKSTIGTLSTAPTALIETNTSVPQQSDEKNETQITAEENITLDNEKQSYDTLLLAPKIKNNMKQLQLPREENIALAPPIRNREVKDFTLNDELKAPGEPKTVINMSVKSLGMEESLLKNFHSTSTFKTAFELANYYFDSKEYTKAIVWAKEASKLGPTSEQPWLIYAKSKFHLGEKDEAIRSLEIYLGYSSSKEVKDLLNFYKGQQ
ncbi:MAG: CDC27 family protein [Sulfurospirillaceae bacterium]|nr:CDC27 family protein [Sulfurospirillaceae bacterium]MDD2825830.1 CDC27 family protein [Sulfurospirillaceae bacterium]